MDVMTRTCREARDATRDPRARRGPRRWRDTPHLRWEVRNGGRLGGRPAMAARGRYGVDRSDRSVDRVAGPDRAAGNGDPRRPSTHARRRDHRPGPGIDLLHRALRGVGHPHGAVTDGNRDGAGPHADGLPHDPAGAGRYGSERPAVGADHPDGTRADCDCGRSEAQRDRSVGAVGARSNARQGVACAVGDPDRSASCGDVERLVADVDRPADDPARGGVDPRDGVVGRVRDPYGVAAGGDAERLVADGDRPADDPARGGVDPRDRAVVGVGHPHRAGCHGDRRRHAADLDGGAGDLRAKPGRSATPCRPPRSPPTPRPLRRRAPRAPRRPGAACGRSDLVRASRGPPTRRPCRRRGPRGADGDSPAKRAGTAAGLVGAGSFRVIGAGSRLVGPCSLGHARSCGRPPPRRHARGVGRRPCRLVRARRQGKPGPGWLRRRLAGGDDGLRPWPPQSPRGDERRLPEVARGLIALARSAWPSLAVSPRRTRAAGRRAARRATAEERRGAPARGRPRPVANGASPVRASNNTQPSA